MPFDHVFQLECDEKILKLKKIKLLSNHFFLNKENFVAYFI